MAHTISKGIWGKYVKVFLRDYSSWAQGPPSSWISKLGQEDDKQPCLTFPVVKASRHGRHQITGIRQNLWRNLGEISFFQFRERKQTGKSALTKKTSDLGSGPGSVDEQCDCGEELCPPNPLLPLQCERATNPNLSYPHWMCWRIKWILTWDMLWKIEF